MSEIKCKIIEHESCLKCGSLQTNMIKIGVFTMCSQCWQEEFGKTEFTTQSEQYKNYVAWLKQTNFNK